MLLKFTSLELPPILPQNAKLRADIFKNDEVIDILVWVGLARKLPGLQYLRASCSMHAISHYCETRPKIILFCLLALKRAFDWAYDWARYWVELILSARNDHHQRTRMHGDVCATGLSNHRWFSGQKIWHENDTNDVPAESVTSQPSRWRHRPYPGFSPSAASSAYTQ